MISFSCRDLSCGPLSRGVAICPSLFHGVHAIMCALSLFVLPWLCEGRLEMDSVRAVVGPQSMRFLAVGQISGSAPNRAAYHFFAVSSKSLRKQRPCCASVKTTLFMNRIFHYSCRPSLEGHNYQHLHGQLDVNHHTWNGHLGCW